MADKDVSITFRTSAANRDFLDEIAAAKERDRTYILNEAVEQYLWRAREHRRKIEESRAAAARGELYDQEEVEAEMEEWIASTLDRAS